MCYGCWVEYAKPAIDTPAIREVVKVIEEVYSYSCVGGNLHIVLDDWNLEDHSLAFCKREIERGGHPEDPNHSPWYTKIKLENPDSPEQLAVERKCHDLLFALTEPERASALALYDGYWEKKDS